MASHYAVYPPFRINFPHFYRATQLCLRGLGSCNSVRLSVCLSVRLSHACFVTNPKNLPAIFFIPYERAILLVFCYTTVVGGRGPLPPKMGDRRDPPPSKIAHFDRFPPVTSNNKSYSEKSSIIDEYEVVNGLSTSYR